MNEVSLTHLLDVAICSAEAAGKHALENVDRRQEKTAVYEHDVKLVLDVESQMKAEAVIASEFPDHGILGEEDEKPNAASPYEWIIDPIDGTLNFSHGMEYWCSSVAVRREGQLLAGCVFAPRFNAYYTAHAEDVAKLNGEPIHVSEVEDLNEALIFTGLSKEMTHAREPHFDLFRMMAHNTKKLRINGAAALDICRVAEGTCDGVMETGLHIWDYAAGALIVERAGGANIIYPRDDGSHAGTVLSANPKLIEGLRAIHTKCV